MFNTVWGGGLGGEWGEGVKEKGGGCKGRGLKKEAGHSNEFPSETTQTIGSIQKKKKGPNVEPCSTPPPRFSKPALASQHRFGFSVLAIRFIDEFYILIEKTINRRVLEGLWPHT